VDEKLIALQGPAHASMATHPGSCRSRIMRLRCRMAKKMEAVDNLLDSLVWMRRKAKRHEPVDDLIDALMKMRRKAKKKAAKKTPAKKIKKKPKKRSVKRR
jgi:uncharacterized coiled-coil protein SlyX